MQFLTQDLCETSDTYMTVHVLLLQQNLPSKMATTRYCSNVVSNSRTETEEGTVIAIINHSDENIEVDSPTNKTSDAEQHPPQPIQLL